MTPAGHTGRCNAAWSGVSALGPCRTPPPHSTRGGEVWALQRSREEGARSVRGKSRLGGLSHAVSLFSMSPGSCGKTSRQLITSADRQ